MNHSPNPVMPSRPVRKNADVELVEQVGSDPREVSRVRRAVTSALGGWGVSTDDQDVVALLTSELVTNALRHGQPPVRLHAERADSTVTVSVEDASGSAPVAVTGGAWDDSGGRGLHLVESLADCWGVARNGSGKRVWFRVVTA
jgi:anti-sigma regulatory factor (Ser/Thr protein kinase)